MDDEKLRQIEELGALMFDYSEVALIAGVDKQSLMDDGPAKTAYMRGQLKAAADVRQSILKMAKNGSTPAQKQLVDLMRLVDRKNKQITR